jgi:hypothetical protein
MFCKFGNGSRREGGIVMGGEINMGPEQRGIETMGNEEEEGRRQK